MPAKNYIRHFAPGAHLRTEFTITPKLESHVNEEEGVIHGVVMCQVGEAKGHDVWIEQEFIDNLAKLGAATGDEGVKSLFGHPSMSADAVGTYAGFINNIRVFGTQCIGDLNLSEASNKSPKLAGMKEYILALAQERPKAFGLSIAFSAGHCYFYDKEGNRVVDDGSKESWDKWRTLPVEKQKLYATIVELHGCDLVDTGAATDGLYSDGQRFFDHLYSFQAIQFLDAHPHIKKFLQKEPQKAIDFLSKQITFLKSMSKPVKSVKELLLAAKSAGGVKAFDISGKTADGVAISVITSAETAAVGDSVIVEGENVPPPAGDHVIAEGDLAGSTITTDENGIITNIVKAQQEPPAPPAPPTGDPAAMAALSATLGNLSTTLSGINTQLSAIQKTQQDHAALFQQLQKNPLTKGAFAAPGVDLVTPGGPPTSDALNSIDAAKKEMDEQFKKRYGKYPHEFAQTT